MSGGGVVKMGKGNVLGLLSKDKDITASAFRVYITLYVNGSMTPNEIATELNLQKQGITKPLKLLMDKRYVMLDKSVGLNKFYKANKTNVEVVRNVYSGQLDMF